MIDERFEERSILRRPLWMILNPAAEVRGGKGRGHELIGKRTTMLVLKPLQASQSEGIPRQELPQGWRVVHRPFPGKGRTPHPPAVSQRKILQAQSSRASGCSARVNCVCACAFRLASLFRKSHCGASLSASNESLIPFFRIRKLFYTGSRGPDEG